ncbi:nuclease-related domain-containing protein [Bacillus sp. FJAT-27251]|uniref:nuclease-related domain-containing protein n=1 Tax=Bacillus sp. FJAT-27251 TaxID=1684142 RepID=UPI0006A7B6E4|nr:nuclease-related domain-containing protein [Bacillus sp. FJAT-27251]
MLYKSREESAEIRILRHLNNRMTLTEKDKQHFLNLAKGYEGEVLFDSLTEKLSCECYILNDLLLQVGGTLFQIDTLIILQGTIYACDVKYHEGDYFYETDKLYKKPRIEVLDPLLQLKRSDSLLRQLLSKLGYHFSLESFVVFINPQFTLYQAPLNKPIIFPTQVNRFLQKLDSTPSKLSSKHKQLADKLVSLHITDSPYRQLPSYKYGKLKKGLTCSKCQSFEVHVKGKNCVCKDCETLEPVVSAVIRSIEEYKLLFPNEKITTNVIYEWCKVVTKKRIRAILQENFTAAGNHRWSYYE